MQPTSASEIELLIRLREFPQFSQAIQDLVTMMQTAKNANVAEITARTGLQKAGQELLQEWAQPRSEAKPLPGARRHSKKK